MDIISKAVTDIKFSIPRAVLQLAYMGRYTYQRDHATLEDQIKRKTIMGRVIPDTNVIGGETIMVCLDGLRVEQIDEHNYFFTIPSERLGGRSILTPLSIHYVAYSTGSSALVPGLSTNSNLMSNDIAGMANRGFDSNASIPMISTADCQLAGHNVVLVRNLTVSAASRYLKCVVTNDAELQNFDLRSSPQFSNLCVLAAKSFIYIELFDVLERGRLEGGHEIGVVKSYWDGLADSEQNYLDYRNNVWGEVCAMNDRENYDDFMRLMVDPSL